MPNTRGPLAGTIKRRPSTALPALVGLADLARPSDAPKAPAGLRAAGKAVWLEAWEAPWLDPTVDFASVAELARLEDEIAALRATLRRDGHTVRVPVVTPRGDVVGERVEANPAEQMARRAGKAIADLRKSLGLTPESRARLGLTHLIARQKAQLLAAHRPKEDRR